MKKVIREGFAIATVVMMLVAFVDLLAAVQASDPELQLRVAVIALLAMVSSVLSYIVYQMYS